MAGWFPRGTLWAAAWWVVATTAYVVVSRLLLQVGRPDPGLGAFPPVFPFLVPAAAFCLYFVQILGLFLLFFFSLFVLRTPTRIPFHRWLLSLTLFFAFPVLAVNGLLIPAHMSGQLLWYFLGALSLLLLAFLLFWHASLSFSTRRGWLLFLLTCLSPVLLILSRMLDPQASSLPGGETWAARLFKAGNFLFLYQGLFWPFLAPAIRRIRPMLLSLAITLAAAVVFRLWPEKIAQGWYVVWHVTLPMSEMAMFAAFLSLWGMLYAILALLETSRRWHILLGMLLLTQAMLGLLPYREQEILPFLAQAVLIAVATAFVGSDSYPFRRPLFESAPWARTFSLEPSPARRGPQWRSADGAVRLDLELRRGRLDRFRLCIGEEPEAEADWIVCPVSQVPLLRSLFPTLPRVSLEGDEAFVHIAIWDRHYFSEDLLDPAQMRELARLLLGEIRIWWGQGLVYESAYVPAGAEDQERFCRLLKELARRAGILPVDATVSGEFESVPAAPVPPALESSKTGDFQVEPPR